MLKSWISNLECKVFCYKIKAVILIFVLCTLAQAETCLVKSELVFLVLLCNIFKWCKAILDKAYSFDSEAHNVHSFYAVPLKLEELQSMTRMEAWMGNLKYHVMNYLALIEVDQVGVFWMPLLLLPASWTCRTTMIRQYSIIVITQSCWYRSVHAVLFAAAYGCGLGFRIIAYFRKRVAEHFCFLYTVVLFNSSSFVR